MQFNILESIERANLLSTLTHITSNHILIEKYMAEACSIAMDIGYSSYYEQESTNFISAPLEKAFEFGYM